MTSPGLYLLLFISSINRLSKIYSGGNSLHLMASDCASSSCLQS